MGNLLHISLLEQRSHDRELLSAMQNDFVSRPSCSSKCSSYDHVPVWKKRGKNSIEFFESQKSSIIMVNPFDLCPCKLNSWNMEAVKSESVLGNLVSHRGYHRGKIRCEVEAPKSRIAWKCNCSSCSMGGNTHSNVPRPRFRLPLENPTSPTRPLAHTPTNTPCNLCSITSFLFILFF